MNYDPKLKEAMAKIEKICEEYDCGGYFSLTSETAGEFRYVLPRWAALRDEVDASGKVVGIRLRVKADELPGGKAEAHRLSELTAHFIHSNLDVVQAMFHFFSYLVDQTKEKWGTEHKSFHGYRPHRKDEN